MRYTKGLNVELWQVATKKLVGYPAKSLPVLKRVLVTITDMKIGAPGEFSGKQITLTSLRGIDTNGNPYDKNWDFWPERPTPQDTGTWSIREDGVEEDEPWWFPVEAVFFFNAWVRWKEQGIEIIGSDHQPILPMGDVEYCADHSRYRYTGMDCPHCQQVRRFLQVA